MIEWLNKEHLMLLDSLERVNSSTILERKKKKEKEEVGDNLPKSVIFTVIELHHYNMVSVVKV